MKVGMLLVTPISQAMVIITWKGEVNLGSLHTDWFITIVIVIVIVIAIAIAIAIAITITIAIVIVIVVVTYIVLVYILLIVIVIVIAIFIVIVIVVVVVVIANLFAYAITLCYRYHDFSSRKFSRETNLQFTIGEFPSFSTRIKYCIISFHSDCNQSINGTGCCNPSKASTSYECAQN